MEWLVCVFDINTQKIEKFNIFNHYSFMDDLKKNIKKYKDKNEFANIVRKDLRYYFWSKVEYELIISSKNNKVYLSPFCGCKNSENTTIDVTKDGDMDWMNFINIYIRRNFFKDEAKIDVYDQVYFKFDEFINYIWSNRKMIR